MTVFIRGHTHHCQSVTKIMLELDTDGSDDGGTVVDAGAFIDSDDDDEDGVSDDDGKDRSRSPLLPSKQNYIIIIVTITININKTL